MLLLFSCMDGALTSRHKKRQDASTPCLLTSLRENQQSKAETKETQKIVKSIEQGKIPSSQDRESSERYRQQRQCRRVISQNATGI